MLTEIFVPEHIAEVVSRSTGIPVTGLDESGEERGSAEVKSWLGKSEQPTASFLFLVHGEHSISHLIGAAPGYVGYVDGWQLIEAVRRRPYSVVLFDEVEKAHTSVFNVLLQVLDNGRLTDGQGVAVDFRNTVIIMTSNLGAKHLLSGLIGERTMQVARHRVMPEKLLVRSHVIHEFLNRLDEIVIFGPLSHEQLKKVARLQMKDVAVRLADGGVALELTDAALDYIMDKSYDPVYGARPIRRWLQKKVVTELSRMLIGEEMDENSTVYIDAGPNGSELVYLVEKNGSACSRRQRSKGRCTALSSQ
ncbi:hypothetical protein M0R45_037320 [Rubus argutus]|uniref:Clp ATPase C-terminal domain-containing protein n=1 Tax=Rubus argutus TaxID=59490 RepID=A0AAW1W2I7_RUBAR